MPLWFLGFFLVVTVWLLWAIAFVVVWATVMLAWPVALLIGGVLLWRGLMRRSQRLQGVRVEEPRGRASRNSAFEEYRRETLARLDEESAKFREFLQRLRRSRDKREFDAFMSGRRRRPARPALIEHDASAA